MLVLCDEIAALFSFKGTVSLGIELSFVTFSTTAYGFKVSNLFVPDKFN